MSASTTKFMLVVVLAMIVFCGLAVDALPTPNCNGNAANGLLLVNVALNNALSTCSISQNRENFYG